MSYITRQPTNPTSSSIPNLPSSTSNHSYAFLNHSTSSPNPPLVQIKDGMPITVSTSTSPPLPSQGASIKRHHTVSGGQAGVPKLGTAAPSSGGATGVGGVGISARKEKDRINKLQSDWRRRDDSGSSTSRSGYTNQQRREREGEDDDILENLGTLSSSGPGNGGYRGGYGVGGGEKFDDDYDDEAYDGIGGGSGASGGKIGEDSDRVLAEGPSGLFRQTSLPVGGNPTPGFTTSHSLRPPISSLSRQSSVRSTRDLSFSSTGGPPSSAGPAREATAAAAAAAAVGGSMSGPAVGRSSSLRNPMLSRPDWRLTNDDTPQSKHQRSYSTSSPLLRSGMLSTTYPTESTGLGRSSSIKSVASSTGGAAGHSHTRSMYHLGRESPPIGIPMSTSALSPSIGPMTAVSVIGGSSIGIALDDDEELTPGGSVKRTHSLQQGYGQNSKIQERLARSPALFPTYQRVSAAAATPSSSLGQTNIRREEEPPTSPIRRSPWGAASVDPENDGWAGVRTRDDLTSEFQVMQIGNDISRLQNEMQLLQHPTMGPPSSHQPLYQMAMQDRFLPKMMAPPGAQMLPPIPQSRTLSRHPDMDGRSATPNTGHLQQTHMGYQTPPYQPSSGNYIDLGDGGNVDSARYLPSQHQQLQQVQHHQPSMDQRWQGNYPQSYHQDMNLGLHGIPISTGFDPRNLSAYQGGYVQSQQPYQRFSPAAPVAASETSVKVPDEVAKKAAQEVERMVASKNLNPMDFDCEPANARYFVIKSFTEDDVHKSLKHDIWASTTFGNQRLDKAFQESQGPVYLFFSVNGSGHFCGVAQMTTPVDYNKTSTVWAQDKWKGIFSVKWIFVRDIPNSVLRHIRLLNTQEQKPITNSRDTQELLPEAGIAVLKMFSTFKEKTSLLEDFGYYEMQSAKKAQTDAVITDNTPDAGQQGGRPPSQGNSAGNSLVKGFSPSGPPSLAPSRFAVIGGSMNGRGGLRGSPAR